MVFDINLEIPGKMWCFQRIKANQPFLTQKILTLFAPKDTLWFGISRLAAFFCQKNPWNPDFMVPILDWVAKEPLQRPRWRRWRKDTKDLKGWKKKQNNHCRTKKRWVFKQNEPLFKTSVLIGEKLSTIAVYKFNPDPFPTSTSQNKSILGHTRNLLKRSSFRIGKIHENPWRPLLSLLHGYKGNPQNYHKFALCWFLSKLVVIKWPLKKSVVWTKNVL